MRELIKSCLRWNDNMYCSIFEWNKSVLIRKVSREVKTLCMDIVCII